MHSTPRGLCGSAAAQTKAAESRQAAMSVTENGRMCGESARSEHLNDQKKGKVRGTESRGRDATNKQLCLSISLQRCLLLYSSSVSG